MKFVWEDLDANAFGTRPAAWCSQCGALNCLRYLGNEVFVCSTPCDPAAVRSFRRHRPTRRQAAWA